LVLTGLDRPALEIDRYAGILADLNLRHGVLLSVMPVAQSQLLEASGPFWRNARSEGIAAFEKRQQADYLPASSNSKFGTPHRQRADARGDGGCAPLIHPTKPAPP
jgi:hypothetical protein